MSADALIEWTKSDRDPRDPPDPVADISVFSDGRVRFGPRFGGGKILWKQLAPAAVDALRRFLFEEQGLLEIDEAALRRDVEAARAERQRAARTPTAEYIATPQMDAGTSILRAGAGGRAIDVRYYDLFGDSQRFPEVVPLQRLRAVEQRMLQIAEEHAGPEPA